MSARKATAVAHPNIALAKYWGKRPYGHNLPAVPSLSVTLDGMTTTTTVSFEEGLAEDELDLGGVRADATRVATMLDRVRALAGLALKARVASDNDFPTSAGLASSASGFAALAVAASHAAGLALDTAALSDSARRTSVSSARSLFGGFASLRAGEPGDEVLAAEPVAPEDQLPLRVLVAVTREGPKAVGSTQGMKRTEAESPYYAAWVASAPALFERVRTALLARDFDALGANAEASALAMHASAIAAGIVYFAPATIAVLERVRELRAKGLAAYATMDAGPHVKVLTLEATEEEVAAEVGNVAGVLRVLRTRPGAGARVVG